MLGNLVDERTKWFGEAAVVKRGPTHGGRRLALSFQDSTRKRFSRLSYIRHGVSSLGRGGAGERLQKLTPIAVFVEDSTHFIATVR
jgi:hypothetical protein